MPWAGFSLRHRRPANLERPTLCRRPWAESAVVAGMLAGFVWAHFSPPTAARPPPCGRGQPARRGLQTCAPSLSTVVRDADTRLPCSPRLPLPVRLLDDQTLAGNWFGLIEGSGGLLGRAAPTCIREVTGVRNAPRCNVGAAPEAHTLHRQWLTKS